MRRAGRWPWGLLGMLALVCGVESSVARHGDEFLDMTSVTWALSDRAVRAEAPGSGVLCFGDSLLKFGLDPAEIERSTGETAYNLAVNAGRAPVSYLLLRRALAAGARPTAVLVDFEPNILSQPPLVGPELWAELAGPRDCLELAFASGGVDFPARTLVSSLFPTHRYRGQLRDSILGALGDRPVVRPDDIPALRRDALRNRGALVMPHTEGGEPVAVDPMNHAFFPGDWHCDPLNRRYLRKFFALASARGVPVFWVMTPYAAPIQSLRERHGQDATFTRFAAAVRSRFPGVTVLDGRRSGYDPSVFWDGTVHLDGLGALSLSADVGAVLKRSFAGETLPAWVALPAYRDRSAGDKTRSEIAVRKSRD